MAGSTPPNGQRADRPQVGFTLTPDRRLSPCSHAIPPDEVQTAIARLESQGWERIPTRGRLDAARFTGNGATIVVYHSGLVCTIGIADAIARAEGRS